MDNIMAYRQPSSSSQNGRPIKIMIRSSRSFKWNTFVYVITNFERQVKPISKIR